MSVVIVLPWPSAALSPNARGHWGKKAAATKKARSYAHARALEAGGRALRGSEKLSAMITFVPPSKRPMDTDNMIASCKSSFDGIADAIHVDDSRWSLEFRREEPRKPGFVRIEISEAA